MTYDFIIVGAGSAGCVLAERLTASGRHSVLLLEAGGGDRRFYVQMPLGYGKLYFNPAVNWMYRAEPDPGLAGQADFWPRGKLLGGSSSINAMVYIRGDARDYEGWRAAGNTGWGWDDVLPVFKAIEDNAAGADAWRGVGGPLHVSDATAGLHPLCHAYVAAAAATGLPYNRDFNGERQEGAGFYQLTTRGGRRLSAARAFLRPAMRRKNLRVETRALVTRILFEGSRAIGVEYTQGGATHRAMAGREAVLAAGAVNSPHVLQISGIGPPRLLAEHGIAVRLANDAVGAHLQDHVGVNYTFRMNVPTLNDLLRPWHGKLRAGLQWLVARRGPLSLGISQGGGFFRTDPSRDRPNMQLYMQAFSTLVPKDGERPVLTPDPFSGFSLGLSNCRPTSRGSIAIRSADPAAPPRITPNALSTDDDIAELLDGAKYLRRLAAAPPLAGLIAEELRPGPACHTDAELVADLRARSGTVYHPCGTCRMGPDARSAVVDARLRVHGVQGLRVCDASVFPAITTGNINAPTMMVAWRGAALMLAETTGAP